MRRLHQVNIAGSLILRQQLSNYIFCEYRACPHTPSGANVAAAIKLLESGKLPADAWVVTMLNDSGLKYSVDY